MLWPVIHNMLEFLDKDFPWAQWPPWIADMVLNYSCVTDFILRVLQEFISYLEYFMSINGNLLTQLVQQNHFSFPFYIYMVVFVSILFQCTKSCSTYNQFLNLCRLLIDKLMLLLGFYNNSIPKYSYLYALNPVISRHPQWGRVLQ
jgi:hypothetical protein